MTEAPAASSGNEELERLALHSNNFGWWVLKWRLPIILFTLLLAVVLGRGIPYLSFNPDTRSFFGPSNPERIALDNLEKKYSAASNVIYILTPKDGNVFSPRFLALTAEVTRGAWKTPYAFRADSLTNFEELKAAGEDLRISPLYPKEGAGIEQAAEIKKRALANGELVGRLVSPKGDVTAIIVYVNRPNKSRTEVKAIADYARGLVADIAQRHPEVEVRLTGGIMGDLAFVEAGQRDTMLLVPLMALSILLVLIFGMRSWAATAVTCIVILLTVIMTMGVFGWFGTILNTVTAAAPPVIMTLFFADCVHFVMSAMQQQAHGRAREEAIAETIRLNVWPTLIKTGTTVVGFLSLNFSDSPPLNQLGNFVAVGSLVGCALTITLIPALLSYMKLPRFPEEGWTHKALYRMADWIVARNRTFLYGFAVLFPLLLLLIPTIDVNDNFVHYFDNSFQFRTDTDYLEKRLTGLHGLFFSVPSGKTEGVTDPEYLHKLEKFAAWYRQQPHVAHVSTLADVIRRINRAMNNDDPKYEVIPDNKQLIAQYLMLYELSLPAGQDLSFLVDIGRRESVVTVRLVGVTSKSIVELAHKGQDWLKTNAPQQFTNATGLSVVYSYLTRRNIEAMIAGTAISVVFVSLIMGLTLQSWSLGWISLVVNLGPAAMAFGVWALTGNQVNLAISVVTAITYGIVVDDTVHTMAKYRWSRETLKLSPEASVREVLTYTGGAVILSSVALALGFGLLGFSSFNVTAMVGILSALIIAIAALAELLVLPGLLIMFDRTKS